MLSVMVNFNIKSEKPKYVQLYESIKRSVLEGSLKKGEKLPSIRAMAESLSVSKSTIENAYNQLLVEGYIESRVKSGYYVSNIETTWFEGDFDSDLPRETKLSQGNEGQSYSGDGVEEGSFNFTEWKKALNRVLEYQSHKLLSYGDVQGEEVLREEIAHFVKSARGGVCHKDQIVVGAGIQYLFGLIATLFRPMKQSIAFEYPGFSKGMYIFEDYGYETVKIPVRHDGIDLVDLEKSNAKVAYVSPSHQYPTGSIMPINKRMQLIEWASRNNAYIIEDDYDSLLRYEGYPVPALQGLNKGKNVIYVGSFSKLLTPALRISFMVLPESLLSAYRQIQSRYSQSVSKIEQLALANYMIEGGFGRHIRRIKKHYGKKNQKLIEAFKKNPTKAFELIGSESGLHVVLYFNPKVCLKQLVELAKEEGILLEGVEEYSENRILVFPYSGIPDKDMEQVVATLIRLGGRFL